MELIPKTLLVLVSVFSFLYSVLSFFHFTRFLSDFSSENSNLTDSSPNAFKDSNTIVSYATEATVVDISLLSIFIIVHSSLIPLQDIISNVLRMPILNKTLLNLLTSTSLQLLMHMWMPIPQYTIWAMDIQEKSWRLAFLGLHTVNWILIYIMMITMDITDLFGIKQVYNHITGRPAPYTLKSEQLKHLHKRVRHPSFLGFVVIFWIYPYMRLDRFLMATVSTLYMLLAWRPDTFDYNYLVQQQIAKKSVL